MNTIQELMELFGPVGDAFGAGPPNDPEGDAERGYGPESEGIIGDHEIWYYLEKRKTRESNEHHNLIESLIEHYSEDCGRNPDGTFGIGNTCRTAISQAPPQSPPKAVSLAEALAPYLKKLMSSRVLASSAGPHAPVSLVNNPKEGMVDSIVRHSGPEHEVEIRGLKHFADHVKSAASRSDRKFGDDKSYINSAHDKFIEMWNRAPEPYSSMSLDQFKNTLIRANRLGLLRLSRADLVETTEPDHVVRSRTSDGSGEFHFIGTS